MENEDDVGAIARLPVATDRTAAILRLAEERLGPQVRSVMPLRLALEAANLGILVGLRMAKLDRGAP